MAQFPTPTPDDIAWIQKFPTDLDLQNFEQKFGPGSARQYLGNGSNVSMDAGGPPTSNVDGGSTARQDRFTPGDEAIIQRQDQRGADMGMARQQELAAPYDRGNMPRNDQPQAIQRDYRQDMAAQTGPDRGNTQPMRTRPAAMAAMQRQDQMGKRMGNEKQMLLDAIARRMSRGGY